MDKEEKKRLEFLFTSLSAFNIKSIDELKELDIGQWLKNNPRRGDREAKKRLIKLGKGLGLLNLYQSKLEKSMKNSESLNALVRNLGWKKSESVKRHLEFFGLCFTPTKEKENYMQNLAACIEKSKEQKADIVMAKSKKPKRYGRKK